MVRQAWYICRLVSRVKPQYILHCSRQAMGSKSGLFMEALLLFDKLAEFYVVLVSNC